MTYFAKFAEECVPSLVVNEDGPRELLQLAFYHGANEICRLVKEREDVDADQDVVKAELIAFHAEMTEWWERFAAKYRGGHA